MNTQSNNTGTAYTSPSVELMLESERVYKAFCRATQLNTGLKGTALKQRIKECHSATYKLLFGTDDKQELNTMEQVFLNRQLWLAVVTIAGTKGVSAKELLEGLELPLFP
ncbi:hypothetical protein COO91_04074 [Nostoc flagelliforme CCNUN1]|uniref:Uncharacterized protein n=1 Tax=Nostoc flagelliforme CCNUN1 TaxID=2038116 RepID=A0A2K8SRS0_9NOSO|nr:MULTISPECIES: hypothetical protein [Nostoc]AUB38111.1 hypothetical protein COO91_04074 [Nostoc flagelliforme CCNUN1]MBG1258141.1 hypothetical protein [Nostoc commune BAE]